MKRYSKTIEIIETEKMLFPDDLEKLKQEGLVLLFRREAAFKNAQDKLIYGFIYYFEQR